MLTSTESFMITLEKWLVALRSDDFIAARRTAEHLIKDGELLVIHPEFVRCFEKHCPGFDPKEALFHLCQFLMCATDGRARALTQWLKDNSPELA